MANGQIIDTMLREGRLAEGDVRILAESPPYADYVWAAHRDLPDDIRSTLMDAFLALDPERGDHAAILDGLGAHSFYPVTSDEFDQITSVVTSLGMLEELR